MQKRKLYASQNSRLGVPQWQSQRQDGHFLSLEGQSTSRKGEVCAHDAPAATCLCFLVEQPLPRAQTGCGRRGDGGGGDSLCADPVLGTAQRTYRKHVGRPPLGAWLGHVYPAGSANRDGHVADPAPDRKTATAFA